MEIMCEIDWQIMVGVASSIIALCALTFTIWQGFLARKHNRLSVRPQLTSWMENHISKNGYFKYTLINNGLGPARIEEFQVKVDGEDIVGERTERIEKASEKIFPKQKYTYRAEFSYFGKGHWIPAKEKVDIFKAQFDNRHWPFSKSIEEEIRKRAKLIITYTSIYGERFYFPDEEEEVKK
jgi:hypothetical protein